jgi:hypothetical protein
METTPRPTSFRPGIQQLVDTSGKAHYIPWYEWWVPVPFNLPANTPVDGNGYPLSWLQQHPYINQTSSLHRKKDPQRSDFAKRTIAVMPPNVFYARCKRVLPPSLTPKSACAAPNSQMLPQRDLHLQSTLWSDYAPLRREDELPARD